MENTKMYVVAEVGYEALFEAMVAQAEVDMKKGCEIMKASQTVKDFEKGESLLLEARQGIQDWLKVLKVLDIADAVIR